MSRIVLSLRNLWYFRMHVPTVEALARRGHDVHLAIIGDDRVGDDPEGLRGTVDRLNELRAAYPNITVHEIVRPVDRWAVLDMVLARLIDFFHFRRPVFRGRDILWTRVKGPPPLQRILQWRLFRWWPIVWLACRVLPLLESVLPPERGSLRLFKTIKPDLVAFSPLTDLGLSQFGQLRAARAAGARTAFLVNSWDNLSSKGWVRDHPDRMVVWNEIQAEEAMRIHKVPRNRLVITGCPSFEDVFAFRPAWSREEFCERAGMDPTRPYVIYVGSALFRQVKHHESEFLRDWVVALRGHRDPVLREAGIMIRLHPKRLDGWEAAMDDLDQEATFFPRGRTAFPVDSESRSLYLHSLYFAGAVVGLNTSAFWEAAILGRPTLTVVDPYYSEHQHQTIHFEYLLGRDGRTGILRTAGDIAGHLDQLASAIRGDAAQSPEESAEVFRFLRPVPVERTVPDLLADTIEEQIATVPPAAPPGFAAAAVRRMLAPLAELCMVLYRRDRKMSKAMMLSPAPAIRKAKSSEATGKMKTGPGEA